MTNEQEKQLQEVRERHRMVKFAFDKEKRLPQGTIDIDFLLNFVDSQVAGSYKDDDALARFVLRPIRGCATDDQYIETLERIKTAIVSIREDTTTRMRSACIEKVKDKMIDWQRYEMHAREDPMRAQLFYKYEAAKELIRHLESVTTQEQK